jgi:hypothetical protein
MDVAPANAAFLWVDAHMADIKISLLQLSGDITCYPIEVKLV